MIAAMMVFLLTLGMLSSGRAFACTPTRVWDGDGPIWCAEGPRVRLAGIAAREIDGSCKPSHPCPGASGIAARDALVQLLGGPKGKLASGHILVSAATLRCVSNGSAGHGRTAAWCMLPGKGDLSCALIRAKVVVRWTRYARGRCR